MNQLIFEVREKKSVLVLGIIFTIVFSAFAVMMLGIEDDDLTFIIISSSVFGIFAVLGIYLILAYFFHRLKVLANGELVFSSSIGKKTKFTFRDIVKTEQTYSTSAISLRLKDTNGKCLAKIESNMVNYDRLCQWLTEQRQSTAEAVGMEQSGISGDSNTELIIEPVKVRGTGKVGRVFLGLLGVMMLLVSSLATLSLIVSDEPGDIEQEAQWFDTVTEYEGKQMIEFNMISYPFASFELNDSQGMYFVFDSEMCIYIICMDNDRLETEFADIYEYTFSDADVVPAPGTVEGYAMPIEDDLKAIAIEEFNYLWGETVITDTNFSEYLGTYYLDTTYQPTTEGEGVASTIVTAIFGLSIGIYLIYYAVKGHKKVTEKIQAQSSLKQHAEAAAGATAVGTGVSADIAEASTQATARVSGAGDLPVPRNIFITLLAVILGAAAGGVLWILFYKLGRIAAISGYLAVFGAIWGWTKIGRREKTKAAMGLCIFAGVAMIVLANYIAYAWEIVDAMNATSPGRAEFVKVFFHMPSFMKEWDLWGSFLADLAMGLVFALIAGVSGLFGKKKQ